MAPKTSQCLHRYPLFPSPAPPTAPPLLCSLQGGALESPTDRSTGKLAAYPALDIIASIEDDCAVAALEEEAWAGHPHYGRALTAPAPASAPAVPVEGGLLHKAAKGSKKSSSFRGLLRKLFKVRGARCAAGWLCAWLCAAMCVAVCGYVCGCVRVCVAMRVCVHAVRA